MLLKDGLVWPINLDCSTRDVEQHQRLTALHSVDGICSFCSVDKLKAPVPTRLSCDGSITEGIGHSDPAQVKLVDDAAEFRSERCIGRTINHIRLMWFAGSF